MRSKMIIGAQFCILISLLIIEACVHKSDSFSMDIVHNKEDVYFEQNLFSKGSYPYLMGHPHWIAKRNTTFKFTFQLDDISSIYYGYLSLESWDVESRGHKILLNGKIMDYLPISTTVHFGPTFSNETPANLEDTQIYIPKRFFEAGQNTLEIKALIYPDKWATDSFSIGRLDIVVVKVKSGKNYVEDDSRNKKKKRYFPKKLQFFTKLTDEELYISMVQLPSLFAELNFETGIYRKKLGYIYSKIGDYYRWNGDYTKNLLYQKKAIELETEEAPTPLWPYLKTKLGLAYYYVGDYNLALEECHKALKSLKKINIKKLRKISPKETENLDFLKWHIYAYMALNYYHLEKYNLAEEYAKKIPYISWGKGDISIFYRNRKRAPIANSLGYQTLGHICMHRKRYQEAASYYQKAILILNEEPEIYNDQIAMTTLYLANVQFLEGKYKEAVVGIEEVIEPTHEFKWRSHLLKGISFSLRTDLKQLLISLCNQ